MAINDVQKFNRFYKEVSLGKEALHFLTKKSLPYGATLAKKVLDSVSFNHGQVTTVVPKELADQVLNRSVQEFDFSIYSSLESATKIRELESGDIDPIDRFWIFPMIQEFVQENSKRICIIEDHELTVNDRFFKEWDGKIMVFENEVYHLLDGLSIEKISETFGFVGSWTFICILTSWPNENLVEKNVLTMDTISDLAKLTEKIIIAAFDHEGYLVWQK